MADFRQKYYSLIDKTDHSPDGRPSLSLPDPVLFNLDPDQNMRKHRCAFCRTHQRTAKFKCQSCVRRTVEQVHENLEILNAERSINEKRIAKFVESVQKNIKNRRRQIVLNQDLQRVDHLRELVQNKRNQLREEENRLLLLKRQMEERLQCLEQTHRGSREKWESVKSRVPQASRKISSALKVRRQTLRGVLQHTVCELDKLYPIRKVLPGGQVYTIARLPLPAHMSRQHLTRKAISSMRQRLLNSVDADHILLPKKLNSHQTLEPIFAALGYVVLLCKLLSHYLATPLPFKMRFRGCHSYIEDHDDVRHGLHLPRHSNKVSDDDREFQHVHRAIKLLDHNIRHLCLKFNVDRRRLHPLAILPNLFQLCEWLANDKEDSRILENAQDREIFHPFSSASSQGKLTIVQEHQSGSDGEESEDFVVIGGDSNAANSVDLQSQIRESYI